MRKTILIAIAVLTLSSCQRGCARLDRNFQASERDYSIVMYSGGDTVYIDNFRGIVNNSEHSDGIYYYKNGELIEVSGDYIIKSK